MFIQTCGTNFKCQTCDCHSCIYSLTTKSGEMSGIFSSHKALYPSSRDLINSTILSPSLAHIRLQVHLSVKPHHVTQYSFHFNWISPMLMAVSCLSPVRTQILISALIRVAMVSGTPAWRRSSMAVAPSNIKFCWHRQIKYLLNISEFENSNMLPRTAKLIKFDLVYKFRQCKEWLLLSMKLQLNWIFKIRTMLGYPVNSLLQHFWITALTHAKRNPVAVIYLD